MNASLPQVMDHLFRHEAGKMISVLSRIFGMQNLELAEDVVQEAFLKAIQTWKFNELPENPSAWLMRTAKNKAIDIIRRQQNFQIYSKELAKQLELETENTVEQFFADSEIADSQLQMIFACCHPALKEEDQIALTLKTISGFSIAEVARALVTNEDTIKKRIYRAKEFIRNNNIQLEIPAGKDLSARLDTAHTVLYLLFNEGYNSLKADELIRKDLCAEAIRLCLLLTQHKTVSTPSAFALLSLMCFQASRFKSRLTEENSIVLLQHQDRTKWDRDLILKGYHYLNFSAQGDELSIYHVESAIAAEHCMADSFEKTNWQRMLLLYDLLLELKQTPVVVLNRSIVMAQLNETEKAIAEIMAIENIQKLIDTQYIYPAVLGDLHMRLHDHSNANKFLVQALTLTQSEAEKKLINEKLISMKGALN